MGLEGGGVEQKRKKEEELVDMDNSVVNSEGEEGVRGINGDGEKEN